MPFLICEYADRDRKDQDGGRHFAGRRLSVLFGEARHR